MYRRVIDPEEVFYSPKRGIDVHLAHHDYTVIRRYLFK